MPLATTHRFVGELLSCGALERNRNGRYEIGPCTGRPGGSRFGWRCWTASGRHGDGARRADRRPG
ncbi:hypothetical protein HYQ63_00885 [Streptomyces sp. Rer75]|nr:hypothetical protein HYQ63_00885 [Streptomyces sp. Rer75]